MISLVHVGIRPSFPVEAISHKGKQYFNEKLPDGATRVWNMRMLESGCSRVVESVVRDGKLIYCAYCDEWFNETQFKYKEMESEEFNDRD